MLRHRDKIACAQYVAALSDGFIKRTLQLEGINSLKTAIERSKAIKVIHENSFEKKRENNKFVNKKIGEDFINKNKNKDNNRVENKFQKRNF